MKTYQQKYLGIPHQPEERERRLHQLALFFHAQSEHFDRQQAHAKNARGIAIPATYTARRACEDYARRLLQEMFMEHIYRKISISPDEWRRLTRDTAHEFESLVKQGWLDRFIAVSGDSGYTWFLREYFGPPIGKFIGTHKATGRFLQREDGEVAEIFEPL